MAPTHSNPYLSMEIELLSHFYLNVGSSYIPQLYALSALLAILSILSIITLIVRYRKKQLWLFRVAQTSAGPLISPHPLLVWTVLSLVYALVLQGYIYANVRLATPYHSNLYGVMCWRMLVWLPLLLGGFFNAWATLLATIIPRTPSRLNRFDLARYPLFLNIFFVLLPILLLSAIIPAVVIINHKFNQAYTLATQLQTILEKASDDYVETGIITDLNGFANSIANLKGLFDGLYKYWERVWILYSVFVGICWIIYMGAAFVHWRQIRRSLSILHSKISSHGSNRAQIKSLEWALVSTIFTGALTITMCFCYFVVLVILASRAEEMANNGKLSKVVGLASVYIYVLFGSIATIATLLRSFVLPPTIVVTSISSGSMKLNHIGSTNDVEAGTQEGEGEEGGRESWHDIRLEVGNHAVGGSKPVKGKNDLIKEERR